MKVWNVGQMVNYTVNVGFNGGLGFKHTYPAKVMSVTGKNVIINISGHNLVLKADDQNLKEID